MFYKKAYTSFESGTSILAPVTNGKIIKDLRLRTSEYLFDIMIALKKSYNTAAVSVIAYTGPLETVSVKS